MRFARGLPLAREALDAVDDFEASFSHALESRHPSGTGGDREDNPGASLVRCLTALVLDVGGGPFSARVVVLRDLRHRVDERTVLADAGDALVVELEVLRK